MNDDEDILFNKYYVIKKLLEYIKYYSKKVINLLLSY